MKLICSLTLNQCIGNQGKLVSRISEDIQRFRELTTNQVVIMGANTFFKDLGGKPLGNRVNIVITSKAKSIELSKDIIAGTCYIVSTPEEAYTLATSFKKEVWLIGGASLYHHYLEKYLVEELYITHVHKVLMGDTYLYIDWYDWVIQESITKDGFTFSTYKNRYSRLHN